MLHGSTGTISRAKRDSYQNGFEQPALCDVKAAILGENLDVPDFIIEPAEEK